MSDREAFVRAIIDDPDNDDLRLVYADWLEERNGNDSCPECDGSGWASAALSIGCTDCGGGLDRAGTSGIPNHLGEYAEFIRVQCEMWKTPEPLYYTIASLYPGQPGHYQGKGKCVKCDKILPDICHYHRLAKRERELMDGPGTFLDTPAHWGELWWERGFIGRVRLPMADWLVYGEAICEAHPLRPWLGMFSDKIPFESVGRRGDIDYLWLGSDRIDHSTEPHLVPIDALIPTTRAELHECLVGGSSKVFPSRDEALVWLARRMIELARVSKETV